MRISEIVNRRIGVLGFGLEGRATVACLRGAGHTREVVVLSDHRAAMPEGITLAVGEEARRALDAIEVLIRSPGFPPHHPLRRAADDRDITQTTSTNLFLAELQAAGIPVIGITGSKGKSTTSTLVHLSLEQAGIPSILVGNIGRPAIAALAGILRARPAVVLEMSSYQCDDLPRGAAPGIAAVLNLFPEHLDWHGGVRAYYEAKLKLALSQRPGDLFVTTPEVLAALGDREPPGRLQVIGSPAGLHFADGLFRRGSRQLFSDEDVRLRGRHNRLNAVAALALVEAAGARPEHLAAVLRRFTGLPFRLQDEGVHAGVRWINDSISTAPEATAAALEAFAPHVRTLIVGGFDRGYDPEPIIDEATRVGVATVIGLPTTGQLVAQRARERRADLRVLEVEQLDDAVRLAAAHTPSGAACLFSPGAPSYNQYRSFKERGEHFRALIEALEKH